MKGTNDTAKTLQVSAIPFCSGDSGLMGPFFSSVKREILIPAYLYAQGLFCTVPEHFTQVKAGPKGAVGADSE